MWLLAGLGNPGPEYAGHRHNIGFMVADAIAQEHGFPSFRSKFQGEAAKGRIGDHDVLLLKPLTFMNESGVSVAKAARFYKISPDRIIVLHDELDLEPGTVRVKRGGGLAGHNGLKSIKAHLGTADFHRVRIGIGHPGDKRRVSGYVLSDFSKEETAWVETLQNSVADHVDLLLNGQTTQFVETVTQDLKG